MESKVRNHIFVVRILLITISCLNASALKKFPASSNSFSPSQRYLYELECPNEENFAGLSKSISSAAEYSSNDEWGKNLINKLRDKEASYYEKVVNSAIMYNCDVETSGVRCVDANSSLAAKDWTDSCIVAADHVCPVGTCERRSNCYWKTAVAGEDRETRFPESEYSRAEAFLVGRKKGSYTYEVVIFGIRGIIIAVAFLVIWIIFTMGRIFCCCMWKSSLCFVCSPVPKKRGYRACAGMALPVLLYILCMGGIALCGSLASVGNENISEAATNVFYHSSEMVEDLSNFLGRARTPLVNIDLIVQDAAIDSKTIFNDTEYVQETALDISDTFVDYGVLHVNGLSQSNALPDFNSAIAGFNDQVYPVVDEIQKMLDTLEIDLYENVDTIQSAIVSAISQVDSFLNVTDEWLGKIYEIEGQEFGVREMRKQSVLAIFAIAMAVSAAGFVIMILSTCSACKPILNMLNVIGVICAILGSLSIVLASTSLCVSILWYDVCEISHIVTRDFEPFVGDQVAPGANACFDGTNLAVAFNVTDKVDFQAKLDEGLSILTNVNITDKFAKVLTPLEEIQLMIEMITMTALGVLNQATSINNGVCPFNDTYTKDTVLFPWTANDEKDTTDWVLQSSGTSGSYDRQGTENGTEYMGRIYEMAGKCSQSNSCCLEDTCGVAANGWCNSGNDCVYMCSGLGAAIKAGHEAYLEADDTENKMTSDLGVKCPANYSCPTDEFQSMDHNTTLLQLLYDYRSNVTGTADDLVNLASTSVGGAMDEIQDFLCNMNVSFVGQRYMDVREEICETMFGGVTQLNWALWILSLCVELIAFFSFLLSVRLRGMSRKKALKAKANAYAGIQGLTREDLYGDDGRRKCHPVVKY